MPPDCDCDCGDWGTNLVPPELSEDWQEILTDILLVRFDPGNKHAGKWANTLGPKLRAELELLCQSLVFDEKGNCDLT